MEKTLEKLIAILTKDERFVSEDGKLLKNKVQELARKNDPSLLKSLLSDSGIKKVFFDDVEGITIFDKDKFIQFINTKEFLPDSYTAFTQKINLSNNESAISKKDEVVLNFPYKDCVLEGGMTKEDQKRDEIFFNNVIAPDEITRLLDEKAFTQLKRIDKNGEKELTKFNKNEKGDVTDNLIIKGNNLLGLHSLKRNFSNKVKLIYIDPPYNTGSDSFGYNDKFNHSSWV
jgi:adenine-specific DNA-methyltransferase